MQVLDGLAVGRDRGLGEGLLGGVAAGHAGDLANGRAVGRDERLLLVETSGGEHRGEGSGGPFRYRARTTCGPGAEGSDRRS
jgi:hypothetical protein